MKTTNEAPAIPLPICSACKSLDTTPTQLRLCGCQCRAVRTTKRCASTIAAGQRIMPPARELRLWMRRDLAEKGLPEAALVMTVTDVYQGAPDKRGPWLVVKAVMPAEWYNGPAGPYLWTIKMRPDTLWPVVQN